MTGFFIAAFRVLLELAGAVFIILLFTNHRDRKKRQDRRRNEPRESVPVRRFEFSKLVLSAVLLTYFAGFALGVWAVTVDVSQLSVFLTYVGAPTGVAIGFYSWKAKAENIMKIKQTSPEETGGAPVDLTEL